MKKLLSIVAMLFCLNIVARAQDIIVKNDKSEMKTKVLEITDAVIKYKKFEMQDGPTYSISKSDVFMIIYQNGTKEYMENKTPKAAAPKVESNPSNNSNSVNAVMSSNNNNYQTSSSGNKKSKGNSKFGIQLSLLSTSASVSGGVSSSDVFRLRLGFFCNVPLSSNFAFEPSVNIVGKGAKLSYADYYSKTDEEINTSFIEIPLNFVYTTGKTKGLIIGLAPTLGFRIAQSEKGTQVIYGSGTYNIDGSPGFKSFEFGGNISLGYKFSPKFSLSLVDNISFTNISNSYTSYKTGYIGINGAFGF